MFMQRACFLVAAVYVLWVLAGTVAWVSHLGERVPQLALWLPAGGYPRNQEVESVHHFLIHNVPRSLVFVLPHR